MLLITTQWVPACMQQSQLLPALRCSRPTDGCCCYRCPGLRAAILRRTTSSRAVAQPLQQFQHMLTRLMVDGVDGVPAMGAMAEWVAACTTSADGRKGATLR